MITYLKVRVDKVVSIEHSLMQVWMASFNMAQPSAEALHRPGCTKTWELQSLFLSPTEVVREGLLLDEALGHVAWSRKVVCPSSWTPRYLMPRGNVSPLPWCPVAVWSIVLLRAISFCHLCLCFWIFDLPPSPPTAPGVFFKVCRAEGSLSFAFWLPLAVTQTYSCFPNGQEASAWGAAPRQAG